MSNHARGLWGYSGATPGGRRADDPGDRDGRAERRARPRRPGRAGRAAGGPGRHLRRARRARASASCWSSPRRSPRAAAPPRSAQAGEAVAPDAGLTDALRRSWAARRGRRPSPASTSCTRRERRAAVDGGASPTCRPRRCSRRARELGVALAAVLIVTETSGRRAARRRGARSGRRSGPARAAVSRTLSLKSRVSLCLLRRASSAAIWRRSVADVAADVVDLLLDLLQALRERAQPPLQPFDVARRGQVERAHRRLLGLERLLAGAEGGGDRVRAASGCRAAPGRARRSPARCARAGRPARRTRAHVASLSQLIDSSLTSASGSAEILPRCRHETDR